jgi:hypothetical protein
MRTSEINRGSCWAMAKSKIGWIVGGIFLAVFLAFLFGYVVMLLWNWIMPALFNLPEINYWMAFGIIILGRLIFGGFGSHNHGDRKNINHSDRYYSSKFKSKFRRDCGNSKWVHYEQFWEDEGEKAFNDYVEQKKVKKENPDV